MAASIISLFDPVQLTNADAVYFTAQVPTQVIKLTVVNSSTTTAYLVTINLLPSGGAAGAANIITNVRSLAAKEAWDVWPFIGHVLETGGAISAKADTGAVLNFFGSGLAVSG